MESCVFLLDSFWLPRGRELSVFCHALKWLCGPQVVLSVWGWNVKGQIIFPRNVRHFPLHSSFQSCCSVTFHFSSIWFLFWDVMLSGHPVSRCHVMSVCQHFQPLIPHPSSAFMYFRWLFPHLPNQLSLLLIMHQYVSTAYALPTFHQLSWACTFILSLYFIGV